MSSPFYYQFLNSVWDLLPEQDRNRFAELWQGYEQVIGAIYQKYLEVNLNVAVEDLQPWTTERWLPYTFTSDNFISRPAEVTSSQDLSVGINLLTKYLLKIRIDGALTFEVNVQGDDPVTTKIDEVINKINLGAGFKFAKGIFENTIIQLTSMSSGIGSSIEILETSISSANACEYVLGIDPATLPVSYPKFKYPYTIPYTKVVSIPEFRDFVRDENVTVLLTEGVDYEIGSTGVVSFLSAPPAKLWAERTQTDEENPWANFGFLTGIYQKNSERYINVIQGIWFAFWNGPKPLNVRAALYLLFGLPTAQEDCVVTKITDPYTVGIHVFPGTITTLGTFNGVTRVFSIPSGLEADVAVGDSVPRFYPLVTGIQVYDKISYPGFVEREVGRDGIRRFLTENATLGYGDTDETKAMRMLEEYTFLPQISVESFIYPDISLKNVRIFLDTIRPLNKTYMFQVIVGTFRDLLGVTDHVGVQLWYDLTSNLDSNETTFMDVVTLDNYETVDNDPLNLDPHGILFEDRIEVTVYEAGIESYSFIA